MSALSFQNEWIDKLLSGSKQQTTRAQTDRIKVGDVCTLYNQQRRRITDKPLRQMTHRGVEMMEERKYPFIPEFHQAQYHAHLLGKVEIAEVYDIHPCEMTEAELEAWVVADGFKGFHPQTVPPNRLYEGANMWFQRRYGDDWMHQTWTVIRWDGFIERYFDPIERE